MTNSDSGVIQINICSKIKRRILQGLNWIRLSFVRLLIFLHIRNNPDYLSSQIKAVKKTSAGAKKISTGGQSFGNKLRSVYSNFFISTFTVILLLLVLWYIPLGAWLAHVNDWLVTANINITPSLNANFNFDNFALALWQVHASMIGITFVVIIFLVGTLVTKVDGTSDKTSAWLIREFLFSSKIYIVFAVCLLSMLYIGATYLTSTSQQLSQDIVLFVVNVALVFYLFYTALNFFRPRKLEKSRLIQLQAEVMKNYDCEINKRVSYYILMKLDGNLKFSSLSTPSGLLQEPIKIQSEKPQMIIDINIGKLKKLSESTPILLIRGWNNIISADNNIIGYTLVGKASSLTKSIKNCLSLETIPEDEELSDILEGIQEELRSAIRNGNVAKLERIMDIYADLIESFLKLLSSYNVHYTSSTARTELPIEWRTIFTIQRSFQLALEFAFQQDDMATVEELIHFPRNVGVISIQYNDHLLFRQFVPKITYLYTLGQRYVSKQVSTLAIDRSWRSLNYLSIYLYHQMECAETIEKANNLKEFIIEVLGELNELLKEAIDRKDILHFKEFGNAIDQINEFADNQNQIFDLERQAHLSESDESLSALNTRLEVKKGISKIYQTINDEKNKLWYVLGAWTARVYRRRRLTKEEALLFWNEIEVRLNSLDLLAKAFGQIDIDESLVWDSWTFDESPEGRVVGVDMSWLEEFYSLQGIKLAPLKLNNDNLIAPSRKIFDTFGSIQKTSKTIVAESEFWTAIIGNNIKEKASNFIILNQKAREKQEAIDVRWLIDQQLSEQKVDNFEKGCLKQYQQSASVSRAIEKIGKVLVYNVADPQYKEINAIGFNQTEEKAAFVDGWHIEYGNMSSLGREVGNGENKLILEEICSSIKTIILSNSEVLNEKIKEVIVNLSEKGFQPNIVVINDFKLFQSLREISDSQTADSIFHAHFEKVPVIFENNSPFQCFVADIASFGTLIRGKQPNGQFLETTVQSIDDTLAKELIKKNPKFMDGYESEEASVLGLKNKVWIKLFVKTAFKIVNNKAAVAIKIKD